MILNKILICSLTLIIGVNCFAQQLKKEPKDPWGMALVSSNKITYQEVKSLKDVPVLNQKFRPITTLDSGQYRMYLFVDDTEIMVSEYLEFYYYSKSMETPSPNLNYLPQFDKSNKKYEILFKAMEGGNYKVIKDWRFSKKLPIPSKFLINGKKLNPSIFEITPLPISNISFEQALAYCDWRRKYERINGKHDYKFTLPQKEDFYNYALEADSIFRKSNETWATGNYSFSDNTLKNRNRFDEKLSTKSDTICPTARFRANKFQLYDTKGNLSEMTSEKGVAMGGNYTMSFEQINNQPNQNYSKPESWLGFRCMAIVIIKEN